MRCRGGGKCHERSSESKGRCAYASHKSPAHEETPLLQLCYAILRDTRGDQARCEDHKRRERYQEIS
jgi:hypothetical protein